MSTTKPASKKTESAAAAKPAEKAAAKPAAKAKPSKPAETAPAAMFPFAMPFAGDMPEFPRLADFPDAEELMAFARDNLDAAMKAATLMAKGSSEMHALMLDGVRASVEEGAEAAKAMMDCHSLPDLFDLQSGLARVAFESALAESKKISEAGLKSAEDAVEPLTERFAIVVERFGLKDAA